MSNSSAELSPIGAYEEWMPSNELLAVMQQASDPSTHRAPEAASNTPSPIPQIKLDNPNLSVIPATYPRRTRNQEGFFDPISIALHFVGKSKKTRRALYGSACVAGFAASVATFGVDAGTESTISVEKIAAGVSYVDVGHEESWVPRYDSPVTVTLSEKNQTTIHGWGVPGTTRTNGTEMHATYAAKISNSPSDHQQYLSGKDKHLHVAFKKGMKLTVTAYEINPLQTTFTPHKQNWLHDLLSAQESELNALPIVPDAHNIATGNDQVENLARTLGASAVALNCGPKVWYAVWPQIKKEVQHETYLEDKDYADSQHQKLNFGEKDIIVDKPKNPVFTDPYAKIVSELQDVKNFSFTMPDPKDISCDTSKMRVTTEAN